MGQGRATHCMEEVMCGGVGGDGGGEGEVRVEVKVSVVWRWRCWSCHSAPPSLPPSMHGSGRIRGW